MSEFELDEDLPTEPEIPFEEALKAILTEELVPVHHLYRLSDLSAEEAMAFRAAWSKAPVERKREVMRHLADITEHNFVVDFQPLFVMALEDPDTETRIAGLDGLWDSTDVTLIPPIVEMLHRENETEVRAAAAGSLAHYLLMSAWGEIEDVPEGEIENALLQTFRDSDTDLLVRRVALEALGCINSEEISSLIESAYEGAEHALQLSALFAMGNSADVKWLPIILDELESPYEENRREAARAAGNLGHSDAIPLLAELAYDDDRELAAVAVSALGEIGGSQANAILQDMAQDIELEHLFLEIEEALEEASWGSENLAFDLWLEDLADEEE